MYKYKPRMVQFSEGNGYFTLHCSTKEKALELVKKEIHDDELDEEVDIKSITVEQIKEEVMYNCKDCVMYTIGESICFECGKDLHSRPRRTFVFYF